MEKHFVQFNLFSNCKKRQSCLRYFLLWFSVLQQVYYHHQIHQGRQPSQMLEYQIFVIIPSLDLYYFLPAQFNVLNVCKNADAITSCPKYLRSNAVYCESFNKIFYCWRPWWLPNQYIHILLLHHPHITKQKSTESSQIISGHLWTNQTL